jgi:hypothetical protein
VHHRHVAHLHGQGGLRADLVGHHGQRPR